MSLNISEFKETIEVNRNDMVNDIALINELVINDLMVSLGYNKRKNKNVKRMYDGNIDWIVIDNNIKLAVKVYSIDTNLSEVDIQSICELCASKLLSILIITNGESLNIMRYRKESHIYTSVCEINITEELSESQTKILDAISKETYDLSYIDELLKQDNVTLDKLIEAIENNKESIMKILAESLNCDINIIDEMYFTAIDKLNHNNETNCQNREQEYQSVIDNYTNQLNDITCKYEDAMIKIDELNNKITEYENEINRLSGADRKKALELLDVIEDSEELDRSYVGVINDELINFEELHTFVGRTIQRLYEIKNFDASNYIFNADLFQLVQPSIRNDLIMNNKAYDINLDNLHEDEVLNKLRLLFSNFDDLTFECKKIGTLKTKEDNIESELLQGDNTEFNAGFESDSSSDWETADSINKNNNIFGDSAQDIFEGEIDLDDNNDVEQITNNYLIVQNLLNVDSLVWTDEPVTFNTIKYIGTQEVTFAISLNEGSTYDMLLSKCIDAILAIESYNGNSAIIPELKHKDFSFINNSIRNYTEEYRNYPRINGTRYAIVDVSSVQQVATILLDICNSLNISTEDKFIYFDVTTESKFIIDEFGFNEDSVQLRETDYFESSQSDRNAYAVIRGDMFNNIIITQNSLRTHQDIIGITSDIKTKYLVDKIGSIEDVQNVICKILEYAFESGINVNYNSIGNIIDTTYKIVSEDESLVSPNSKCIMLGGKPVFCSEMQYWQVPYVLIKLHTAIFNNTAIALRTNVNIDAINYYGSEFDTTEPSLSLAIKSFVDYMTSCVKNN